MKKHLQRVLTLCLTLVFLLALLPGARAVDTVDSGYCGGEGDGTNLTWTLDSEGVLTISGTGKMADYDYDDHPWVEYRQQIQRLEMKNGIDYIGEYAFYHLDRIEHVEIPSGVTSIGYAAFEWCSRMISVKIPSSVTSIGGAAFYACDGLTSVTIPDGTTSIGSRAFESCSNLTSIMIPSSVTNIGEGAFQGCSSLTDVVNQSRLSIIERETFSQCWDLKSVTIPPSVTTIEWHAFYQCKNLTDITIPNSVENIEDGAFSQCDGLTSIIIPSSVTHLEGGAFFACNLLEIAVEPDNPVYYSQDGVVFGKQDNSLVICPCGRIGAYIIPAGITTICECAFEECSLTSIFVPISVVNIDREAFHWCKNLEAVYYQGSEAQWNAIALDLYGNDDLVDATIYYNSSRSEETVTSEIPKSVDDTLPTAQRYVPYSEAIAPVKAGSSFNLVSGALPQGLTLSGSGVISGMPTEIGGFSFAVKEAWDGGTTTHNVTLFVYTQSALDVEENNLPGYGFVETETDNGRVQDQVVASREELTDQTMHCEAAFSEFRGLYLDAKLLTKDKDYTAEAGSTKITISAETIGDAGGGTHTLAAEFVTPDSAAPSGSRSVFTVQNYTVAGIASKEVHVTVEGELVLWTDAEPYIDTNNRTMTPFRAVGEALGLTVAWDSSTREASFTDGAKTIYFPIGSTTARGSDGSTVTMDTSAVIVNGRTYAPIRYLAEFFGRSVSWDGKTRTVVIE